LSKDTLLDASNAATLAVGHLFMPVIAALTVGSRAAAA